MQSQLERALVTIWAALQPHPLPFIESLVAQSGKVSFCGFFYILFFFFYVLFHCGFSQEKLSFSKAHSLKANVEVIE